MKFDRKKVLEKTNNRCGYCGCQLKNKFQIDHIIPKARFHQFERKLNYKVDDIQNLLAACYSCNNYKSVYLLEDLRSQLRKLVERCNNHNAAYRIAKRFGLITENKTEIVFYFERNIKKESEG